MPGGRDAGGAMDVSADVALLRQQWRARVQADANSDRAGGEPVDEGCRGGERALRCRKCEEEGVPLRVHLSSAVRRAGLPDQAPVVGERLGVGLRAELVQQRRRAFDVGEDKRDSASWKLGPHDGIIRR